MPKAAAAIDQKKIREIERRVRNEETSFPLDTTRLVRPREEFGRFSGSPDGTGSFLTKSTFETPQEAVDALFLGPFGNPATFRQPVVSTQRSIVLEGLIKNGASP